MFIHIIKKNGFDISACITLMYIITSFFAVLLGYKDYQFKYENYSTIEINLLPTLVYCFSIGICIYPFYKFNSNRRREFIQIPKNYLQLFNYLVYIYFFSFILLLIIFWQDILFRIFYGNMGELRDMMYEGDLLNVLDTKVGIVRVIGGILTVLGDGSYFMIPFFFYSICFLKKNNIFNFMILLSSLSPVLLGFINIDRSKTAYWFMLFVLSFVFFRPYIVSKSQKKELRKMVFVVGGLLLFYLAAVTVSRFGEKDGGTSGGLLVYLGQPFLNFCNIWNNIDSDHFFIYRSMPLTSYVFSGLVNANQWADYIVSAPSRNGLHLNVFFSFIGMFLVDMGRFMAVIVPILIFFITRLFTDKFCRSSNNSLHTVCVIFAFAAIVQCGIITYFYTTVGRALSFWFFIWISKRFFK